ncbi:hypothetical protein PInf_005786 [Phytophthora infestans]|nr:hypothetical protein PInf_005786 [Phytophthora infestans]
MKALRDVATLFKHGEYSTIPKVAGGLELEVGLGDAEMDTTGGATGGATGGVSHQTRDSEVVTEVMGVVQVITSRQEDTTSQSVASVSYVESTQVCPDQSGSVGIETGTGGGEVVSFGNETGATGGELVSDENETGTHGDELVSVGNETSGAGGGLEVETSHENDDHSAMLASAKLTDDFQIVSPPKSKRRPKQKPRAVTAKRNQAIVMVEEDLEMHERQMSLLTVYELLDGDPIYKLTHEKLLQFKELLFATKPKPPIAHEIAKLPPPTKPLMRPEEVMRIFPIQLINKCTSKVTAYQAKKPGTLEMQLALEIVGVGVFANSTVSLMRKWHTAVKFVKKIKRAITWIDRLDFAQHGNSSFYVEEDTSIPKLLKDLPILSNEYADLVDPASKDTLSAQVMQMILHKLFGADPSVLVIDPSNMGISNGALTTDIRYFKLALAGVTKKMKVLFPINCNNNHWCAVLMDLEKGRVYVYDSMASSYMIGVRAVAQKMIMMLPDGVRPSARLVTHDPGLGVQCDSYNCGVYVLLVFEMFCGSEPLGDLDKKTLQCMRYRYLRMCIEEQGSSSS